MSNIIEQFCKLNGKDKNNIKDGKYTFKNAVIYIKDGMLHREDGPAFLINTRYNYSCIYYKHNKVHREDGPASIKYSCNKKENKIMWVVNGKIHKTDGPSSIVVRYENNNVYYKETWFFNGIVHRVDEPAITEKLNNEIISEKWYTNNVFYKQKTIFLERTNKITIKKYTNDEGKIHNDKECAYIQKTDKGIIKEWHVNGLLHRVGEPASINILDNYVKYKDYENGVYLKRYKARKLLDDCYYLEI